MVFLVLFFVFMDNGFDFFKLLPVNTITTKTGNLIYQYCTFFLILLTIFTAIGDIYLYKKNKNLNQQVAFIHPSKYNFYSPKAFHLNSPIPSYNLSEKYQLHENYVTMRLIMPLDITFLIFVLISNLSVIVLRNLNLPTSLFLAHYQFLNSVSANAN